LPLKVAGTGATLGGAVGAVAGVPGVAIGAAIGGTVGAVAGTLAKGAAEHHMEGSRSEGRLTRASSDPDVLRRDHWQEEAGRDWGPQHYVPGDMVRTLATRKSWKEKTGRSWGGETYQLGDISRTLRRTVFRRASVPSSVSAS